jgi:glutamate/tyrosine decarboxylase-like PLP-dependent enzyme
MPLFDLSKDERLDLWKELTGLLEEYYGNPASFRVAPPLEHGEIAGLAGKYSFELPVSATEAINHVISSIRKYGVQVSHPSYYGLFNPRPNFASIMADMITATMNPQIAAWSHSPFAAETESYLIRKFGAKFGLPEESVDGVFCNGGAEANHTAVLCALNNAFPEYAGSGLRKLQKEPVIYCSEEAHHSVGKAAMLTGLGRNAVTYISANNRQQMDATLLNRQIGKDIDAGKIPFLVVVTTGTTGSGAIDPVDEIYQIAREHKLWMHVDAAYGGAAILDDELAVSLRGIEHADSITFDMHKWMSVPMGTSIILTRDPEILHKTFRITTEYMPHDADGLDITDPYIHSMQWSRRYIGLRTYLSMIIFGWEGYQQTIRHQTMMGELMQEKLIESGWEIINDTPLPVVCFTDPSQKNNEHFAQKMCTEILASGQAWISTYKVNGINSMRACITNYATTEKEIHAFVHLVNVKRAETLHSAIKPS